MATHQLLTNAAGGGSRTPDTILRATVGDDDDNVVALNTKVTYVDDTGHVDVVSILPGAFTGPSIASFAVKAALLGAHAGESRPCGPRTLTVLAVAPLVGERA